MSNQKGPKGNSIPQAGQKEEWDQARIEDALEKLKELHAQVSPTMPVYANLPAKFHPTNDTTF